MKTSYFIYCFLFLATVAIVYFPQRVAALGFGVSPSNIDFVVEKGSSASRQLMIYNTGEEAAEFSATSSSPTAIKVSPNYGTIPEGGTTAVKVTAAGKSIGAKEEEISIGFTSSRGKSDKEVTLSLGTAVKVKVLVVKPAAALANALVGMLLSASIVFAGLAAYYMARKKPGKLAADFQSAYDLYLARK